MRSGRRRSRLRGSSGRDGGLRTASTSSCCELRGTSKRGIGQPKTRKKLTYFSSSWCFLVTTILLLHYPSNAKVDGYAFCCNTAIMSGRSSSRWQQQRQRMPHLPFYCPTTTTISHRGDNQPNSDPTFGSNKNRLPWLTSLALPSTASTSAKEAGNHTFLSGSSSSSSSSATNGATVGMEYSGHSGASSLTATTPTTSSQSSGLLDWLHQKVDESLDDHDHNVVLLDVPRPTENGGYTHTKNSRAKISAANKGKVPWNKGKERSEEVKARIAAGVRRRNREQFLQKLADQGMTEEEYNAQQAKIEAERAARRTEKGGYRPTEETKQKLSKILKAKHATGEVKKRLINPARIRRGFTHSEETRAKISEPLRKRWADDEEYRTKMLQKSYVKNNSPETRKRISETLKRKWEDPEFRAEMESRILRKRHQQPGLSHREKISAAIKAKWQDPEYRSKATEAMAKRRAELENTRPPKQKKAKTPSLPVRRTPKSSNTTRSNKSSSSSGGADLRLALAMEQPEKPKLKGVRKSTTATNTYSSTTDSVTGETRAIQPPKRTTKRETTRKAAPATPASPATATNSAATTTLVKKKRKRTTKTTKEPPGSKARLREERRDLYDLLYGDELDDDDDNDPLAADQGKVLPSSYAAAAAAAEEAAHSSRLTSVYLEDENLDDFDPYGLDNF